MPKRKKIRAFLCAMLVLCAAALAGCGGQQAPVASAPVTVEEIADAALTVRVLDVGQADCILLQSGGEAMLIDAGEEESGPDIVQKLEQYGVDSLKLAVATHAHADHVGGYAHVIEQVPIGEFWLSGQTASTTVYNRMLDALNDTDTPVHVPAAGQEFALGECTVRVIGPQREYEDLNDSSLVLMVQVDEVSMLFTGDMEAEAEQDLLNSGQNLKADVLKVGHHGSSTSTSAAFLTAVSPQIALISCGEGNRYGHPHEETLSALSAADITVLRTDQDGEIAIATDGQRIAVNTSGGQSQQTQGNGGQSQQTQGYIGNARSHVLHSPWCSTLPAPQNQVMFEDIDTALEQGYTICNRCRCAQSPEE